MKDIRELVDLLDKYNQMPSQGSRLAEVQILADMCQFVDENEEEYAFVKFKELRRALRLCVNLKHPMSLVYSSGNRKR